MPIEPDIKKELDRKYALGDITEQEYLRRLEVLEKSSRKSTESRPYEYDSGDDSLEDAPTVQQNGADLSNAPTILQDKNEIADLSNAPTIISPDGVESFVDDSDVERNTEDFINRYEFQSNIGQGGMGEVSLYKDTKLNRLVAVKRLRKETTGFSEQANRRFKAEAQTIAGLNHQNIVSVYDIGEDKEGLFIIMEYIDGTDLSKYIKIQEKLPVEEALKLIRQVAQALNYAHRRKIFHRDIKPANILLNEDNTPKIVDFGLAKAGGDTSYSMTGFGMGTMAYAAPEQKRDAKNVDHRADIYALGATLYELVTGSNPSVIKSDEIPSQLKSLILKCVEEKPENRYFSIDEMLSQIDKITGAGIKIQQQKRSFGEAGVCPQCQYQNPTDVKFCQNCGTGLTEKCLKCQFENTIWSKRCGSCGVVIDDYKKYLDHVTKGDDYFKQKKYSRAIKEYKLGLDIYKDSKELKDKLNDVEKRYEELKNKQVEFEQLYSEKKYDKALPIIEYITNNSPENEENNEKLNKLKEINKEVLEYNNKIENNIIALILTDAEREVEKALAISPNIETINNLNKELKKLNDEVDTLYNKSLKEFENNNITGSDKIMSEILKIDTSNSKVNELSEKIKIRKKEILELLDNITNHRNKYNYCDALKETENGLSKDTGNEKLKSHKQEIIAIINQIEQLKREVKDKFNKKQYVLASNTIDKLLKIVPTDSEYMELKQKYEQKIRNQKLIRLTTKVSAVIILIATILFMISARRQAELEKRRPKVLKLFGMENFVLVQAGTFMMGSPENESGRWDNERQHRVTITRDYYIGKYPVTQTQWEAVMGNNPSGFKGANRPVGRVSWNDVKRFIRKLNRITGKNFRLPTEAEWEYAARGGNKSKGYIYSGSNNIDEVAWYSSNSNRQTHPVGRKKPNELGIYDMSGNVWEWCSDWYGDYSSGNVTDPTGARTGSLRVARGGSWDGNARRCRSAYRFRYSPVPRNSNLGFRLCLPAGR